MDPWTRVSREFDPLASHVPSHALEVSSRWAKVSFCVPSSTCTRCFLGRHSRKRSDYDARNEHHVPHDRLARTRNSTLRTQPFYMCNSSTRVVRQSFARLRQRYRWTDRWRDAAQEAVAPMQSPGSWPTPHPLWQSVSCRLTCSWRRKRRKRSGE